MRFCLLLLAMLVGSLGVSAGRNLKMDSCQACWEECKKYPDAACACACVNTTALSEAATDFQYQVEKDFKSGLTDVCEKTLTGSVAATATARAFAKAVATATASVGIEMYTTTGGNACGEGRSWAKSVASAVANATAQAFADVPCCPMAAANASGYATAIKEACDDAIAEAYQQACASDGQSYNKTVTSIEYAVANATALAFAQAFADIESCSELEGCPIDNSQGTCTCPCPCAGSCYEGPAVANVTVTSTGFGQSLLKVENKTEEEVKKLVDGICAGLADDSDASVTASANAVAEATVQALASVAVETFTTAGGSACGEGEATATSVAKAIARASAKAMAEAKCCPNAAALAAATANATQSDCQSAVAHATLSLCSANGEADEQTRADVQAAVADAVALAFTQAIADIESCSQEAGCPPTGPCACPALPTPPPCTAPSA